MISAKVALIGSLITVLAWLLSQHLRGAWWETPSIPYTITSMVAWTALAVAVVAAIITIIFA